MKPLVRKSKRQRNAAKSQTIAITPQAPVKQAVAVKEMTMNRLDFGELIFGGNIKNNLKAEVRLNKSVNRVKSKTLRSPTGLSTSQAVASTAAENS